MGKCSGHMKKNMRKKSVKKPNSSKKKGTYGSR